VANQPTSAARTRATETATHTKFLVSVLATSVRRAVALSLLARCQGHALSSWAHYRPTPEELLSQLSYAHHDLTSAGHDCPTLAKPGCVTVSVRRSKNGQLIVRCRQNRKERDPHSIARRCRYPTDPAQRRDQTPTGSSTARRLTRQSPIYSCTAISGGLVQTMASFTCPLAGLRGAHPKRRLEGPYPTRSLGLLEPDQVRCYDAVAL
jgi:hypothetical protein